MIFYDEEAEMPIIQGGVVIQLPDLNPSELAGDGSMEVPPPMQVEPALIGGGKSNKRTYNSSRHVMKGGSVPEDETILHLYKRLTDRTDIKDRWLYQEAADKHLPNFHNLTREICTALADKARHKVIEISERIKNAEQTSGGCSRRRTF